MSDEIPRWYRSIDLEPGASLDEVRQAYRMLVKVWHPDRFSGDPTMQRKAVEKLQKINNAYEELERYLTRRSPNLEETERSPSSSGQPKQPTRGAGQSQDGYPSSPAADVPPCNSANRAAAAVRWRAGSLWAASFGVIVILHFLFSDFNAPNEYRPVPQVGTNAAPQWPLTYYQIRDIFERARVSPHFKGMSLPEFSQRANQVLETQAFSAGLADSLFKQASYRVKKLFSPVGITFGDFAIIVSEMIGFPANPAVADNVGSAIPRVSLEVVLLFGLLRLVSCPKRVLP